jgi:hypothetical protein
LSENHTFNLFKRCRWNVKVLAACLMLTLVSFGAHAVIVKDLILFSAVKGRVLDHGKPAVGLKIGRETFWNMEKFPRQEFTTTDKEGYFAFPELRATADFGFLAKLFHVPTVTHRLDLFHNGEVINMYSGGRSSYEPSVETGYPIIELQCDLSTKYMFRGSMPSVDCELKRKANGAER